MSKSVERFEIELISKNYMQSKRVILENEENILHMSSRQLEPHRRIVYHIEYVVRSLDERDRFIIEKEVMEGRRGKWYLDYFTEPSYYRNRIRAYKNFLNCL